MKKSTIDYKSAALKVRLASVSILLVATISLSATALMQGQLEQTGPPSAALATSIGDLMRKESDFQPSKVATKSKAVKEPDVPVLNLITTTSYPFSSASAVALEDMSSGTTQLVDPSTDDNNSALSSIGFEYWYDGVRFTQFGVNGNGFARLGAATTGTSFTNSIGTATNAPKIMPFWDDICVGTNGKVHFKVVGSAPSRKLVIEFQNMQITRGAGCAGTGGGTFQMWLFETTGVIEFVYGTGMVATQAVDGGYSVGLQSGGATNFASVTTVTNTVSYAAANNTQTSAIASGVAYLFTPQTAVDPTGLNFTATNAVSTTLNWTDNSGNEVGFVVSRSTDGVNYSFLTQTAANATSLVDNGLSPGTQYFYQVRAVTEGALSGAASNSVTTSAAGNISSTAAGGNWSATATWVGGVVPTVGDNVTIVDGATVTVDTAAVAFTVTVGTGGATAVLQYEAVTARTLTTGGNVTIATNGTLQSASTGTVTTHVLSVGGNLTNNGVLDFSTNANTAGAGLTFINAANSTFGGSGATTDIRGITVNKGTSSASVVEVTTTNFTVQGVNTDVAGFLTLTNGTLKISGTFTMTNRVFTTATYTIPATTGFWLNNPNFAVAPQAGGTTSANNGLLRMTQGTYGIGITGADGLGGGAGATFIIEGGTINATRIDPQNAVNWTQSSGTVNVGTVANTRSNFGAFELFSTTATFIMSGGTINLIQATIAATPIDYQVLAASTITGGTLNVGTAATATNFNFRIRGNVPNLVVDNTTNNKTATLTAQTNTFGNVTINSGAAINTGSFIWLVIGPTITNNGTITVPTSGSRFYFLGTGPQSYTGSGTCTIITAAGSVDLTMDNPAGLTIDPASGGIVTQRVNFFRGNITNSNKLTLGNGGVTVGVLQYGLTGATVTAGNFDVAPVFNVGTGGQTILYAPEPTPRTTSVEIPPSRTITNATINNTNGIVIAGGDLTIAPTIATSTLTLTLGNITTSNALILNSATTVSRTSGHVIGNLRKTYTAVGSKVFEVGTLNGFSPATINVTAGAPGDVTVRAVQGKQPNVPGTDALQRYWQLTAGAGITADLTLQYLALDVVGTEGNYLAYKYTGSFTNPAGSSVDTVNDRVIAPGQAAFTADWTAADPAALVAIPGTLQFSAPTYSVAENVGGGLATITVTRTGGTSGAASIDYATSDGTASGGVACGAGVDYVSASGTLNWADTDGASKTFDVTICNDAAFENNETVNLGLTNATGATAGSPATAVLTITNDDTGTTATAGQIVISEFRVRGAGGASDEFIELYNASGADHTVFAASGTGYGVAISDGTLRCTIPNATVIPNRGHYLCTNSAGYSLGAAAAGDTTYSTDIVDNVGIALFNTDLPADFTLANRLDAVGSSTEANTLYKEGTGYPAIAVTNTEHTFFRSMPSGVPTDTDNNATDFLFADTVGSSTAAGQRLGAPGPENLASPLQRNATIKAFLIDPPAGAGNPPNRVRDFTSDPVNNSTFGTLEIRRKFTNQTGAPVTRLRFRVVDMTTFPSPPGTADLRPRTSTLIVVATTGGPVNVEGTTLEQPPSQPNGGGLNSTMSAGTITLGTPLGVGASINVRFLLGVQQAGGFRFFINVEALP